MLLSVIFSFPSLTLIYPALGRPTRPACPHRPTTAIPMCRYSRLYSMLRTWGSVTCFYDIGTCSTTRSRDCAVRVEMYPTRVITVMQCVATPLGMVACSSGGNSRNREATSSVFDSHFIHQSPVMLAILGPQGHRTRKSWERNCYTPLLSPPNLQGRQVYTLCLYVATFVKCECAANSRFDTASKSSGGSFAPSRVACSIRTEAGHCDHSLAAVLARVAPQLARASPPQALLADVSSLPARN